MKLNNKKILIIGMAKSGYNIAKLLCKDNDITLTENKIKDENKKEELEKLGVKIIVSDHQEDLIDSSYDLIIRNPGVDPHKEVMKKVYELGIPCTNEVEVAYSYLPKSAFIIGITGSNGKTTTTTIIYELLKKAGLPVVLGGNIGYPISEIVPVVKDNSILVLEISDHQLYDAKDFKTNISVLTNLAPTHLDFHDTYENYINVKKKIFNNHTKDDLAIINFANDDSLKITKDITSHKEFFNGNNAYIRFNSIYINNQKIISLDDILLKGQHNYEDIMAALLVAKKFNVDNDIIIDYLKHFKGVEHRCEFVREKDGVKFYNDSKSTNPTSTKIALTAFEKNVHLILGGMERKQDFNEIGEGINKVKCIYAIGECENRVLDYANTNNIKCIICNNLKNAMDNISKSVDNGDIVLLSPACASWDQYEKFEDRGDEYKMLVNKL